MSEHDPLDIAYMAIGAKAALNREKEELEAIVNGQMGELDFIGEVISYVSVVTTLWAEWEEQHEDEGFPGCWLYEVTEEFGEKLGLAIIQKRDLNMDVATEMCRQIIAHTTRRSEH